MSITFWVDGAPTKRVQPYPDEPDYWITVAADPFTEINMTAGNTNAILALISPEDVNYEEDPHGLWGQAKLAKVRSAILRAINVEKVRRPALADDYTSGGPGQCRIISFGRDDDYVQRRLNDFLSLVTVAMEHNMEVSFG